MSEWADGYFTEALERTGVPGAVVIIVDHGQIVFSKGYGTTLTGGTAAIDPERTLFRVGSISKVFTALVASQMIEEGAIDPGAEANQYLRHLRVPSSGSWRPVTIGDLLLHEGGFGADLRGVDAATDAAAGEVPPRELQRLLVSRVRPPGLYPAYDNNGWGLLGLALADASGQSYRELVAARVFRPFGMTHAVVGVPDDRIAQTARDHHVHPDGAVEAIDWQLLKPLEQGAGDISASAADMARFMTALLQRGNLDGQSLISPGVYNALTNFDGHRVHPALPGYGRALYEDRPAGRIAMRHDGGMSGSAASMMLYPEAQIGVFFAINARPANPFDGETLSGLVNGVQLFLSGGEAKVSLEDFLHFLEFHKGFAERYVPMATAPPLPASTEPLWDAEMLQSLQGTYVGTSSQYESFIGNLQVGLIEGRPVVLGPNATMLIGGTPHSQIAPGLFVNDDTGERLAFVRNGNGTFLASSWLWRQRMRPAWQTPLVTIAPLIVLPLFLFSGLLLTRRANPRRLAGFAVAALGLVYLIGWLLEAEYATPLFVSGQTAPVMIWRTIFALAVIGLAAWPVWAFLKGALSANWKGVVAGVHLGMLSVAAWSLVALAIFWNLLNPLR